MISLTRREFDAVSAALLEALADAKRRELPVGIRRPAVASQRAPARLRSDRRALRLAVAAR